LYHSFNTFFLKKLMEEKPVGVGAGDTEPEGLADFLRVCRWTKVRWGGGLPVSKDRCP
jgi:hypothetical protein